MRTFLKILLVAAVLTVVFASGAFYAPRWLVYSTCLAKADVVVVLLGPDFNARHRHARNLIYEGMADYLVIPAYHKTYYRDGRMIKLLQYTKGEKSGNQKKYSVLSGYYEDTHIELQEAKEVMESNGYMSAIFVSSPYHMRRIQLMVNEIFNDRYKFYFSPTPFDPAPLSAWELKMPDWQKVRREYTKILWFMIYYPFAQ